MLTIENKKIYDYLEEKNRIVDEGIKVSKKIEKIEKEIKEFEVKEREITSKIVVKELEEKGNVLNDECQQKFDELQKIVKEIETIRLSHIPKEMKDAHMALMKQREELEREQNKLALKVQKVKDRVVPLVRKVVKPLLKEYDDIETADIKNGKVVFRTFNYLEDFKRKFKR